MKLTNDCFQLRFNLHRSGYDFTDNSQLFSGIFSVPVEKISACLKEYDKYLDNAAKEILALLDMEKVKCLEGKTLLLLGDSITSDRVSYGKIAERMLPCKVVDCAISGSKTSDILNHINNHINNNNPDIVSVFVGTNDHVFVDKECKYPVVSIEEYKRNLILIAEKVKSYGAKLIFHSISNIDLDGFYSWDNPKFADCNVNVMYNNVIKEVAGKYDAFYNDMTYIFDEYPIKELLEPDGVHLSPFAHRLWVVGFVKMLMKMFI